MFNYNKISWGSILVLMMLINAKSFAFSSNNKLSNKEIAAFDNALQTLMTKYHVPGLAAAISSNNSIIYSKGFGYSDIDNNINVTPETPFRIASLTKTISSTIIMQLVESNTLDLNWKIKDYYPDYLGSCKRILGYFEQDLPEYAFLLNDYEPERSDITLKHHLSHTAETTPGEFYKYNGFLFGMLTDVIESVTKSKFDSLVDKQIIEKLSLTHSLASQLDNSKPALLERLAKPYIIMTEGNFKRGEYPDLALNTGAGIISTVSDLMIFDSAINQDILISKGSKKALFTPVLLNNGLYAPYGLGWFSQQYKDNTIVWHYGWQPNAYSGLYLKILEQNLTLILLANSEGLSQPFSLAKGNVLTSDFARAFIDLVIDSQ